MIEILPGSLPVEKVLEEIARFSYELADKVLPSFAQPFEVPASLVDFKELINDDGLHLDYLNGRLCSTHIERKENRYFFDAHRFEKDRGSAEVFMSLVKLQLEGSSENKR